MRPRHQFHQGNFTLHWLGSVLRTFLFGVRPCIVLVPTLSVSWTLRVLAMLCVRSQLIWVYTNKYRYSERTCVGRRTRTSDVPTYMILRSQGAITNFRITVYTYDFGWEGGIWTHVFNIPDYGYTPYQGAPVHPNVNPRPFDGGRPTPVVDLVVLTN